MGSLRSVGQAKINLLFFQDIITLVIGILILVTLMLSLSLGGAAAAMDDPQLARDLKEAQETLARLETENRHAQEQSLSATALPKRELLESQIAALRRETNASCAERRRSDLQADEARQRETLVSENLRREQIEKQSVAALEQTLAELKSQLAAARTNTALYIVPAADAAESARVPVAFIVSGDKIQMRRFNTPDGSEARLEAAATPARALFEKLDARRDSVLFYFRPSGAKWFLPLRDLARGAGFQIGYDAIEEQQQLIFERP